MLHAINTIALQAARRASSMMIGALSRLNTIQVKEKGRNDYVTEVDLRAEEIIVEILTEAYPDYGILSEEGGLMKENEDTFWIIDPLDGTKNYIHGVPHFSISIALSVKAEIHHGMIYDPIREEVFAASKGAGAFLNQRRLRVSEQSTLPGALIGTGFPYREQAQLDQYLGQLKRILSKVGGVRRTGSAALDLAYVAAGRYDGFWETGLKIWDVAAASIIVKEAGGIISDYDGKEQTFKADQIVAGNENIHGQLIGLLKD